MAHLEDETIVTGFGDTKEFITRKTWKIQSIDLIVFNKEHVTKQVIKFSTHQIPNEPCSWTFGFQPGKHYNDLPCINLLCMLNESNGDVGTSTTPTVQATLKYQVLKSDGSVFVENSVSHAYKPNEPKVDWLFYLQDVHYILQSDNSALVKIQLVFPRQLNENKLYFNQEEIVQDLTTRSRRNLYKNLKKLWGDETLSDVKIITSDQGEIKCHKNILSMQNPVFEALFRSNLSESKSGNVKTDFNGKTMKIILYYLYTGDLLPSWSDVDIIVEFTEAADYYQLEDVLLMLDEMLGGNCSEKYSKCYIPLLGLVSNLQLVKAERRLLNKIHELTGKVENGSEYFDFLGDILSNTSLSSGGLVASHSRK